MIPIEINGAVTRVYVDSGAWISVFSSEGAQELLQNDYRKGAIGSIVVGDGTIIPVFFHVVPIKIGHILFKARIGVSPRLKIGFNLLGRKDIFDRFKVLFDERRHTINFIPYKNK